MQMPVAVGGTFPRLRLHLEPQMGDPGRQFPAPYLQDDQTLPRPGQRGQTAQHRVGNCRRHFENDRRQPFGEDGGNLGPAARIPTVDDDQPRRIEAALPGCGRTEPAARVQIADGPAGSRLSEQPQAKTSQTGPEERDRFSRLQGGQPRPRPHLRVPRLHRDRLLPRRIILSNIRSIGNLVVLASMGRRGHLSEAPKREVDTPHCFGVD